MSTTKKTRNPQARVALLAALALLFGGTVGVAGLRAQSAAGSRAEAEQGPKYKSSIQVPNDEKGERSEAGEGDEKGEKAEGNEAGEANEANEQNESTSPEEQAEAAQYQKLARITAAQARSAALASVPGTATGVELENEDGNLVYGVTIKTTAGEKDVKVDAGNGKVLQVEQDEQD
ncbi:MAG TPA: PepSY domain-containing protein [Gemmatimonadaceae bacterium]|nr:PepSY domain-containing protein [Gemmatimonadaceae bacterium]